MVVVQFLATDQDAPGQDVRAGVLAGEVAVAPEMADAVDDAGGPERNPGDLHREDDHARYDAEQRNVDQSHDGQAGQRVTRIDVALHPVIGCAMAVALERILLERFLDVQEHAAPEHAIDAELLRAVRVFRCFAFGVMLAVHGRPFLRDHARGHPQPQPEEVARNRMQLQRTMRLATMQKYRDRNDGDVRHHQSHRNQFPNRQIENA